ncbi:hypothetical protein HYU95_01220 [Candidatus Daviesbacteria bacterium]|nr:hypothetical protein [Candidatus Daviesbacteria bacterium]
MGVPVEVEKIGGVSETRNSWIRKQTNGVILGATRFVHEHIPGFSPTHLNILGAVEGAAGALVAATRDPYKQGGEKGKTAIAAILTTDGALKDAFDGSLARMIATEDPTKVNFKKGQLYDAASDRTQELSMALSRAWSAHKRGDRFAELAALATAIISPWSSVSRAFAEYRRKRVPESGRGLFGLAGTRVGSAAIGELAMLYPEPKDIRMQAIADSLMVASKIITTADRLRTAFAKGDAVLSEETREDAKTRLMVMGGFAAISLAGSLFTYWRMHRNDPEKVVLRNMETSEYQKLLGNIEQYCQSVGLNHRFVGGTITDLIGPETNYKIEVNQRKVTIINPEKPKVIRSDGSTKDIDMVVFTVDRLKLAEARRTFGDWKERATAQGIVFPQISMEAARYSGLSGINSLRQFVTAWEVDSLYRPYLVFGKIRQQIKLESIAPWTVEAGNGLSITAFNPVAHALCYELRVPSGVKPKDKETIGTYDDWVIEAPYSKKSLIDNLARQTIAEGKNAGVNYNEMYRAWKDYIKTLTEGPDLPTKLKGEITGIYWKTIGTKLTHGLGIFGKLSNFNDRMSG